VFEKGVVWLIKYRDGILVWVLSNVFLLTTIPFSWLYYDVRYYYEWVEITWSNGWIIAFLKPIGVTPPLLIIPRGLLYIYEYATKASYPPIPILLFVTTHTLATRLTNLLPLIRLIDKIPLVIAFNMIYLYLKKNYGWKTGLIWLITPFSYLTIYTYHTDLLVALFLLLAYTDLTKRNDYLKNSVYTALASLVKPFVAVTALIPITVLYRRREYRAIILYTLTAVSIVLLVTAPYLLVNPRSFIDKAVLFHADRYPQEHSLWAIPVYVVNYNISILPPVLKYLWTPIYLIALIYIVYKLFREKELNNQIILKYYLVLMIASLIVNKIGNLNYYIWLVPLLIIYMYYTGLYRETRYLTIYIAVGFAMTILSPLTTFYTAFIVQGSIYIIEDSAYYSAVDLASKSFDEMTIQYIMANYFRREAYWLFNTLYTSIHISYIVYTVIYNLYLIYTLYKIKGT